MNLAPVLDLSNPNKKSFIGNRSFGEDPVTTATAASLFAKGLQESKVLATAKHFPGHGNVSSDSHVELPYSNLEKEELFKSYLVPYQKLIESKNISAVMMAHMAYPKIDEVYPATYSKKIISMLRDELGFQGIIMTDDIQMIGANIYSSIAERAVQALLAGNDMIMVAWNFPDQYDAFTGVLEAVKSGKIPESRIDESFNRILKAKESFGLFEAPEPPKPQRVIAEIDDPLLKRDIHSVFTDLMEQEQIKNQKLVLENLEKKPLVVISPDEAFLKSFKTSKLGRKILTIRFKKSFSLENLLQYQKRGKSFTGIYHVTGPGSANQAENIPSQLRSSFILVNNFYPGAVSAADSYKAVIDIPLRNASMGPTLVSWLQSKFVAQAELSSAE